MKAPLSYVPVLPAAVGLVAGILLYKADAEIALVAGLVSAIVFFVLYLRGYHYVSFFPVMLVAGLLLAHSSRPETLPEGLLDRKVGVEARVEDVFRGEEAMSYSLKIIELTVGATDTVEATPRCLLTLYSQFDTIPVGAMVQLAGKIRPIVDLERVPYCNSYEGYMLSQGICYRLNSAEDVKVVAQPDAWHRFVNSANLAIYRAIIDSPVSEELARFMLAVLIGEKSYIDPELGNKFRSLGLAHVLALSGLHVGVLAMIIGIILLPLRLLPRGRVVESVALILLLWLYSVICGMGPSILRATVMVTVFIISGYLQRGYYVFNSLLLSIVIILLINPMSLFTPGFQLSVAAVASILAFSGILPKSLQRHRVLYYIANLLLVPVSAIIGTGIISAFYFHTFPLAFLPSNILGAILFPVIFIMGVVMVVFELIGVHFELLGTVADWIYSLLTGGTSVISAYMPGEIRGLTFTGWTILPYAIGVILLAFFVKYRRWYMLITSAAMFATALIVVQFSSRLPYAELHIVLQSRCTHIICREGDNAGLLTLCGDEQREYVAKICDRYYSDYLAAVSPADTFAVIHPGKDGVGDSRWLETRSMPYVRAGNKVIYIADGSRLAVSEGVHVDYLLLSPEFTGDASVAVDMLKPDTVLFAPTTHPSRRGKWHRQLGGTVPVVDIFSNRFSIYE